MVYLVGTVSIANINISIDVDYTEINGYRANHQTFGHRRLNHIVRRTRISCHALAAESRQDIQSACSCTQYFNGLLYTSFYCSHSIVVCILLWVIYTEPTAPLCVRSSYRNLTCMPVPMYTCSRKG